MNIKKTALVTHRGCMDGTTCRLLFSAAGGLDENVFLSSPSHDETDEVVSNLLETWEGPILMADVSISYGLADTIVRNDVRLLDHHKTAIPLRDFSWCEIDIENSRSGGMMLYDYLKTKYPEVEKYKQLVTLADDYDRWIKNYPESRTLGLLHNILGHDLFFDRFRKTPETSLLEKEKYLLQVDEEKLKSYIEQKKKEVTVVEKEVQGHKIKVGFVSIQGRQNELGEALYTDPALGIDAVVMVGGRSISLRASSQCPVDLSKVAKRMNGGGHAKAGGFPLESLVGQDVVDLAIEKMNWE